MAMIPFNTLDKLDPRGKRILLRVDLNVPMKDGVISDFTRIERIVPTIRELADKGGRVIVLSHFDRPKGKVVPDMSLQPIATALATALGKPVSFAHDCIGPDAEAAAASLKDGEVLLLENTRFQPGEETNAPDLSAALANLGDVYVNDAFSAAHRAHASTAGVAEHLPAYAGRLMEAEIAALDAALENPERPVGAIVGGAKVSTKLALLENMLEKVDVLAVGGAMANTFLAAKGYKVGKSLKEEDMLDTARQIMAQAEAKKCELILPVDVVLSEDFMAGAPTAVAPVTDIPDGWMALDVGPETVKLLKEKLAGLKTLVWNGPLGVFEMPPFDEGTNAVAQEAARLTKAGALKTIAGGGDTVSALRHAGVLEDMTYVSTAGGAFLEWLEGKVLPGLTAISTTLERTIPI
ncbi:phosphoglycerate kinase [Acetobacter tropicalis]|uniref:Phosphoglycerate kinase n=3 Tax=Acetobacter TaxID=434 RepID=A0A149TY30_9PROT|nr:MULTISPECIES: phosphoglycerate kinase [Acetobacter]ATJ90049.1 phosphoglycerate kinase [Acetobacter tropicalis]KAA8388180.1 phosphoglycerate kinase [Acetobacter tropicalis]KAA8390304.1 phosphoglycerate kinase [Acetobacter tropicalis]KGB24430.1 Phosphoglycerate kinase [Acetobacter tropicalis]KXV48838.1 phosphoglycerate kinase [Acetobacter tropicalis]